MKDIMEQRSMAMTSAPLRSVRLGMAIVLIALVNFVAGRLGLLLAIPPGFASAVFPPAGIALACLLLYGHRVWPGVWLGSFCINISLSLDTLNAAALFQAAPVAAGIATGSALQVLAGAWLIRSYVGFPHPLDTERAVVTFLGLGGPASCVIAASVGVTTLWWAGVIPSANALNSASTWWVGDTLGVLIFTPLVLIWAAEPRAVWRRRWIPVALPLAIMFAGVVVLFVRTSGWEQARLDNAFAERAQELENAVMRSVDGYMEVLYATEGLYAASEQVRRDEFRLFGERMTARHPGLQALAWVPRIAGAERERYEAQARRDGYPGFQITERDARGQRVRAAPRDDYFAVYYVAPDAGNEAALGYDHGSEAARRETLERARDSGQLMASGRITLVHDRGRQAAVLVAYPIYRSGRPHETIEERRAHLLGFALGAFRIGDMVEAALQGLPQHGITLRLEDDTASLEERGLYSTAPGDTREDEAGAPGPQRSVSYARHGRQWTLRLSATPEYLAAERTWHAWGVFAGGLLFTSLLEAFLLVVTGRSAHIEALVAVRTAEIAQTNAALEIEVTERQQAEERIAAAFREKETLLKEVHHRVKNNLQVISSLLDLQSGQTQDAGVRAVLAESQGRVRVMALIHQILYERKDFSRVDLGQYLERLTQIVLSVYPVNPQRIALKLDLAEMYLDLERAMPCALLVNELLTNAFKHAFPDGRAGEIRLTLKAHGDREAVFTLRDNGVGLPVGLDITQAASLGLQLVPLFVDQIHGSLRVESGPGACFELRFPTSGG